MNFTTTYAGARAAGDLARSMQKRRRATAFQDASRPRMSHKIRASVLDCASPLALFHRLPIRAHFKFIRHRNPIRLEPIDGFHHRRRSHAFKPCHRAPRILAGHRHQSVFHRVLMDVIQSRQIRALCVSLVSRKLNQTCRPGAASSLFTHSAVLTCNRLNMSLKLEASSASAGEWATKW